MLTVAIPKRNKLQNIIVLTPKDGTGLVLKICETKNNVWKKYELSIQNGIDNCTEIIKIKPDFASLNKICANSI